MDGDARLRQAWIDWINAQYTLADTLLTLPPTAAGLSADGGDRRADLTLGAAELMHGRRKGPGEPVSKPRKRP